MHEDVIGATGANGAQQDLTAVPVPEIAAAPGAPESERAPMDKSAANDELAANGGTRDLNEGTAGTNAPGLDGLGASEGVKKPSEHEVAAAAVSQAQILIEQASTALQDAAGKPFAERTAAVSKALDLARQAGAVAQQVNHKPDIGECPLFDNDTIAADDAGEGVVGPPNPVNPRKCTTPGCGRIAESHFFQNGQCPWAVSRGVVPQFPSVVITKKPEQAADLSKA